MTYESASMAHYLYGVARIGEQQTSGWAYSLSDALGSVRQLADGVAQVMFARGYMPYVKLRAAQLRNYEF